MRLKHYSDLVKIFAQAVYIVQVAWVWPHLWLKISMTAAFAGILTAGLILERRHLSTPCELCLSTMPLDAYEQAERKRRSLVMFHLFIGRLGFIGQWGLLVVSFVLPPPWWRVPLVGMALILIVGGVVAYRHRPLQLACPWCGWDDRDDDEEHEPVPDPVGSAVA